MLTPNEERLLDALQDPEKMAEIIAVLQSHQLLPELLVMHCDKPL